MKILVVSQRYWPESFRITDIAESLVSLGHDVTALTGLPNYPQGYIYDGYKNGENRIQERNGVKIIRAKEIERRNNILFRFLNYYSFPHYANKLIRKLDDYDVVLINELSPIMGAIPGIKYAKKHGKKILMYEMDLWPESLLAGGITHKSILYKYYKKVSAKIYSQCDKILVSTKEHIQYIKDLPRCSGLDIEYLPQYAESIFEEGDFSNEDDGIIDFMFAGNIGKAQSLETIIRAASCLAGDNRFRFHIVGGGSELENMKNLADELGANNVIFYGQKPLSEMPDLYKKADVMLVSLEDKPYANMTIPGKTQSYMAAGKPIIAIAKGSCASFVLDNQLGYVVEPGNSGALADLINGLDPDELIKIGTHSRDVYFNRFRKRRFIDKLLSILDALSIK